MAAKEYSTAFDVVKFDGTTETVGTPSITVLAVDSSNNVLLGRGATVPTDNDNGYAVGCLFIDTTGGVAITLYVNEGDADNCDFNAVESAASTVTGVTAGTDLTGGGTEGTVTLNVSSTLTQDYLYRGSAGLRFGTAVGSTGSAAIFRFDGFTSGFGTATSTAFTGNVYNIAIQVPNVGTCYIKATNNV